MLPPADKYWVTAHGVKLRKPTAACPYYRVEYRVGGRRVLRSVGKDEEAAWAEAVRADGQVAAASGRAADLPVAALAAEWQAKRGRAWAARYRTDTADLLAKTVLPAIGAIPLGDLTLTDVEDLVKAQDAVSGRRRVFAAVSAMLHWGKAHKWLTQDPAELLPAKDELELKPTRVEAVAAAEIPDTGDVMALFRHMLAPRSYESKHARRAFTPPEHRAYMVLVAGFCGLRQGEVFALRGKDLAGDLLLVDEQVQMVGGVLTDGLAPKVSRVRKVVVPEAVEGVPLLAWLTARAAEVGKDGLLFPTASGGAWRKNNYGRDVWGPARRAVWAEHARWSFHSLRHHCATWMLARGVEPKDVSLMLGHSSVRITLDLYVGHTAGVYDRVRGKVQ